MTTFDSRLRDNRRVRRLRSIVGSRAVMRAAVLAGLSGIAWLAGVAAAHAEPNAVAASDEATQTRLSSLEAPVVEPESAESEQAALTPANQLESDTASILDVPKEVLGTSSKSEAPTSVASADVANEDTVDNATAHEADGAVAAGSTETTVAPLLTPLAAAAEPATGKVTGVAQGVGHALSGVTGPLKATTQPVDSLFTQSSQAPPPAMLTSLLNPLRSGNETGAYRGAVFDVDNGVLSAAGTHDLGEDSVESVHGYTSSASSEVDSQVVRGALPHHNDSLPISFPVRPDHGAATSGAVPAGASLYGPASADSGTGSAPVHADRDAEVSRVAPSTAVIGQLPDFVTDPAVSPD